MPTTKFDALIIGAGFAGLYQLLTMEWEQRRRQWLSMPYLEQRPESVPVERYVWGVTAGILRNLYRFLLA